MFFKGSKIEKGKQNIDKITNIVIIVPATNKANINQKDAKRNWEIKCVS